MLLEVGADDWVGEVGAQRCVLRRVAAQDSYVPLAAAANLVLVQEPDIEQAAQEICEVEAAQ